MKVDIFRDAYAMIDKIYVVDDIVDKEEQEKLKSTLLSRHFPWFYLDDMTILDGKQQRPGFSHYFVQDEKVNSNLVHLTDKIIENSCDKINVDWSPLVLASRAFLQLPLHNNITKGDLIDTPHVDREREHTVILYYVKTMDGDTIIYTDKGEKKVTPQQGRVVIFNGNLKHTATQPVKGSRCVININIV